MLQASNGNRGLVEINEERPYRFVYTLSDALGNTSKVRFTVQGQKTIIAPVACSNKKQAIVAVSVETGEESIFASKRDLTRQIGIDKRTLANRLRSGKLYGSFWFKVHSPPQQ
jgi:hypothetical protein